MPSGTPELADELEAVADELATIAERLADIGMRSLREAIARRETSRPQVERQVTRARHAVERAIGILTAAAAAGEESEGDEDP